MSLMGRTLTRMGIVLLIAGFAAVMCAGPGMIVVPATAMWAQPLICPAGSTLTRTETPSTDSDGSHVTAINLWCVDREGVRQAANLRTFLVLGGIYLAVFFVALLALSFVIRANLVGSQRSGPPPKPLTVEGVRQVQDLMAQNRKIEAIKLVRQLTGSDLMTAKTHVETIAASPSGPWTAAGASMPKAPDLSQTAAMEELKRLRAQLDSGQITEREFQTRAAEIAMRLSGG
jgi:hypothetical protein